MQPGNPNATLHRAQVIDIPKTLNQRWRRLRADGHEKEFNDTWIITRAARWLQGAPEPAIINLRHVPAPCQDDAIIASGDGAGGSEKEKNAAGWGGVVYAPATPERPVPRVHLMAGPVTTNVAAPEYEGATKATNTAGELIALTKMLHAATDAAASGQPIEIQSDSRLAIMAAIGIRSKKTKRKRRAPRQGTKDKNEQRPPATAPTGAPPVRPQTRSSPSSANNNDMLAIRAHEAYRRAQIRTGYNVTIRKIKAHEGHAWNEIADALAAIGRTSAVNAQPDTAEVIDRLQRAIDGFADIPDITCQGFTLA